MAEMPYSGLVVQPFGGSSGSLLSRGFRTAAVLLETASALPTLSEGFEEQRHLSCR